MGAQLIGCRPGDGPPPAADPSSVRTTGQGAVVGFASDEGAHLWRGIPFAAPPRRELRWRAPHRPEAWDGTREALHYGSPCIQVAGPGGGRDGASGGEVTGSEDCLYLDIHAPRFEPGSVPRGADRLPVMFWIHGGGNTVGDARMYDGSVLAASQNVIVVTTQYRLGALGWFSHPALRAIGSSIDDRSGNYGTLDLVRALEWVQENIAAFGGDPARVTVFGESAGGRNTFSMLLSPRAAGLFSRAIVQSGGLGTVPVSAAENFADDPEPGHAFSSREVLLNLLAADGSAKDRSDARSVLDAMSDEAIAKYLRALSPAELLSAYDASGLGGMYRMPRLMRDGRVLPHGDALSNFRRGTYNRVPVILGSNRDENKLFMLFGSKYVSRLWMLPLRLNDPDAYDAYAEYSALMWKVVGVDEPATALRAVQGPTVFGYRFDWDHEPRLLWLDLGRMLGAAHGLEIPFVFGRLSLGPATRLVFDPSRSELDGALAQAMMSYWSQFAYEGDPGRGRHGDLPRWLGWGGGEDPAETFIVLDAEDGDGIRMSARRETREALIARVATDERLPQQERRCEVYRGFASWTDGMDDEDYARVEEGACSAYPLEVE